MNKTRFLYITVMLTLADINSWYINPVKDVLIFMAPYYRYKPRATELYFLWWGMPSKHFHLRLDP